MVGGEGWVDGCEVEGVGLVVSVSFYSCLLARLAAH